MYTQNNSIQEATTLTGLQSLVIQSTMAVALVLLLIGSICFKSKKDDDDECEDEKVASFQISPWSCLCNIFRATEPLQSEPDDFRFTTCSVQSMDISSPVPKTNHCYLPQAVDGTGIATKKFLDSHGQLSKLNPDEREQLKDSRVVMKAYLISKLVSARYTLEDGTMNFNERAEDNHIDVMEYKERTQNMYDLLYAGQISVDTRATRRQQRVALKRLKKSNLNLRPSKIRELAKQMKKEAETQKEEADTISSGVDSGTYDLSKAESNDSDKQDKSVQSTGMNRLMKRLGLKGGSHDSALGMSNSEGNSSLGSFDGNMTPELPKPKQVTVAGGGGRTRQIASYGGAQFWKRLAVRWFSPLLINNNNKQTNKTTTANALNVFDSNETEKHFNNEKGRVKKWPLQNCTKKRQQLFCLKNSIFSFREK